MELPRDETAFFGRQSELADIARRFDGGARLVTVVGLGGVGKTRVAVAAAARRKNALFVPLGGARSLEAAIPEVAAVAGVRLKAESQVRAGLGALAAALAKRTSASTGGMLLVLDNTEQLGAAARELASALLDGAQGLSILATSREPLGVRGEEKVVLAPLDENEAVELLRDRARASAGSAVDVADADALAIVRRVDRLPLAIELAASRLEVLSPPALLARLSERLDVLTDASGAARPAHRTMRATLDWSWDLLSGAERSVLAQAAVFAAPFGVDAAEEIVQVDGHEVLDVLEGLVKRSLLVRLAGADGRVRLAMYETVRAWAREKLPMLESIAPAAVREVHRRHALHHLAEAERAASHTYGERGIEALDTLEELLPELLAAFEETKKNEPATAARIVLSLSDLLLFRSLFELRADLFGAGAEAAERADDARLLARALVAKARVTLEEGRIQDAERELRRALDVSAHAGDEVTAAEATRSLGWALTALGRSDEAEAALLAAQGRHRDHGSARGLADAHVALGILRALQGRPSEGLTELREALAIHVEHGDVIRQEKVLGFGGLVGHDAREIARGLPREVLARTPKSSIDELPDQVAELVRGESEARDRWQQAIDLYRRGALALDRGDDEGAVGLFDRAVSALDRAGVKKGVATIHAHASAAFAVSGDAAEASARLARARSASASDPASDLVVSVFEAAVAVMTGGRAGSRQATAELTLTDARELLERASRSEVGTPELSFARRVLERALAEHASTEVRGAPTSIPSVEKRAALVVGREARWIVPPRGERVDLVRYGPVRRLLERLVVARLEQPGVALSADALIEAGWPGERMRHTAGLLRVYSAVRRLRRLGLEPVLVTRDDGYLLDPDAAVRRDER